ncbi:hypothetical protein L0128_03790 [candidate division KSB1 bacterium]|nr:hypothetical protein [candidate division KSB1 bacterium]
MATGIYLHRASHSGKKLPAVAAAMKAGWKTHPKAWRQEITFIFPGVSLEWGGKIDLARSDFRINPSYSLLNPLQGRDFDWPWSNCHNTCRCDAPLAAKRLVKFAWNCMALKIQLQLQQVR